MKVGGFMLGIQFGNVHSFNDLHLLLTKKEIGSPAVKVVEIEIPGADEPLDLTEFFGEAKLENVTHKFEFSTIVPHSQFLTFFSSVKNALHGKKVRIILDDDPNFYYYGRLHVSSFTNEKNIGMISVDAVCDPYKYKVSKTVVTKSVDGTATVILTNGRKRAVPDVVIATESGIRIEYQGSNIWDLGSGTFSLPELELVDGDNTVTVTGTGTVEFAWQEGML